MLLDRPRLVLIGSLIAVSVTAASITWVRNLGNVADRPTADLRHGLIDWQGIGDRPVSDLTEELARLQALTAELQRRLAEYEEVQTEAGVAPEAVILHRSRILTRSAAHSAHLIEIDKGAVDRVHRGMAVTVGWSLVGVVAGEQSGRSLVRLITDPGARIPAKLLDLEGGIAELGVCAGTGDPHRMELRMVQDQPGLVVEPGLFVLSLGGPDAVPADLLLGVVESAERHDASDHWQISIRPLRNVRQVASVLVLREQF